MLKKILALIFFTLFAANYVEAQTGGDVKQNGNAVATSSGTPSSTELEEAARLSQTVVKLYGEGKYDEALPHAKRVLEIRERLLGGEHLQVVYALNNLASVYQGKGKSKDAETLYKRAISIMDKSGKGMSSFAADLSGHLGSLYAWNKEFKDATPLLNRSLAIQEKLAGSEGAALVPALFNLTDLYLLQRDYETAYNHLRRAVAILGNQAPHEDLATAKRLKNYLCPLMGRREADEKELASSVNHVIWRLEEPKRAAEFEKVKKERAARGESDKDSAVGGVLNGRAIVKPQPSYPSEAKRQGIMGMVLIKILVDETGKVIKAEPVCGNSILAKAGVEAARGARFTPTLLSGMPVKVSGLITYNFVLQ